MRQFYLISAIVGAVVPLMFFFGFFHGEILIAGFIPALFASGPAGGFTADLLIASFVFWVFMFNAASGPRPTLFIILNLTIGLSCALPAYLYARTGEQAST